MLETMRSLRVDLEILKIDNLKLMNSKSDQEEINELILNNLTYPPKNNGQNLVALVRKYYVGAVIHP